MTVSVTFGAFGEETLHPIFLRRGFHARILWPVCCDINHVPVGHTGEAWPRPYGRIVGVGRIGARLVDHPRAGVWAHCPGDGRACRHRDTHNLAATQSKKKWRRGTRRSSAHEYNRYRCSLPGLTELTTHRREGTDSGRQGG